MDTIMVVCSVGVVVGFMVELRTGTFVLSEHVGMVSVTWPSESCVLVFSFSDFLSGDHVQRFFW